MQYFSFRDGAYAFEVNEREKDKIIDFAKEYVIVLYFCIMNLFYDKHSNFKDQNYCQVSLFVFSLIYSELQLFMTP